MDVVVGCLDDIGIDAMLDAGLDPDDERWTSSGAVVARFSLLNIASVAALLRHATELDGVDSDSEVAATQLSALPWMQSCVWLPADLDPPPAQGGETWVGSSFRLKEDLERMARMSPLQLGERPPRYDEMRSDYRSFVRAADLALDGRSAIQWVWRALYDAAELSIRNAAPMQLS